MDKEGKKIASKLFPDSHSSFNFTFALSFYSDYSRAVKQDGEFW